MHTTFGSLDLALFKANPGRRVRLALCLLILLADNLSRTTLSK
ncbi:MAG: hypothetical protein WAO58_01465 [Fimbriimonadaceae bacterium]